MAKVDKRTYVYVDGFSLYYRAVKNTPYKWLDLKALCGQLLQPINKIEAIKYFTAIVSGKFDPRQPTRQQTYIRALREYIPEISVYYGQFLSHVKPRPLAESWPEKQFVNIIDTEEKGSDVNLAVHLLNDAWLDKYDCAVIISNDSDLAEAVKMVREDRGKVVGLFTFENCHPSKELIKLTHFVRKIRQGVLATSQLPDPIPGTNIRKPEVW